MSEFHEIALAYYSNAIKTDETKRLQKLHPDSLIYLNNLENKKEEREEKEDYKNIVEKLSEIKIKNKFFKLKLDSLIRNLQKEQE